MSVLQSVRIKEREISQRILGEATLAQSEM
jgi:hypothetical protein